MSQPSATIAQALEALEVTRNDLHVQGDLHLQNAYAQRGIVYAELFDGKTTLPLAFDPQDVPVPGEDCRIEAVGSVEVAPMRAGLILWVEDWRVIGASRLQEELEHARQLLKKRNKKRRLPKKLRHVLVIGPRSDSAHATQDFLNALNRHPSGKSVKVSLRQVRMRGNNAAQDIAAEIAKLRQEEFDLYCVVSGGGDSYALQQVFAAPVLVDAVCKSPIPALVGVGHSKDDFPLDDAALWCADTPSAAGAMLGELIRERQRKCYLVTATCGPDSLEVQLFSHIRDTVLARHRWGRGFIRLYYTVSPPLARLLEEHPRLRTLSYRGVVRPMYRVCKMFLRAGEKSWFTAGRHT